MSLYTISLFLHVSGAIGACVSISIWLFGLAALRRAQRVEQVRAVAWLIIIVSPLIRVSGIEPLLLLYHNLSWYLSLDRQGRFLPDTLIN